MKAQEEGEEGERVEEGTYRSSRMYPHTICALSTIIPTTSALYS